MRPIRIFLLSDHLLFAHGLKSLLDKYVKAKIVGQETKIKPAIEQIESLQPDIVIIDNTNSPDNEIPELAHILQTNPDTKVIGLSLKDNDAYIYRATERRITDISDLMQIISQSSATPTNQVDSNG